MSEQSAQSGGAEPSSGPESTGDLHELTVEDDFAGDEDAGMSGVGTDAGVIDDPSAGSSGADETAAAEADVESPGTGAGPAEGTASAGGGNLAGQGAAGSGSPESAMPGYGSDSGFDTGDSAGPAASPDEAVAGGNAG